MLNRIVIQKIAIVFVVMLSMNCVFADEFINRLTSSTDTVYFNDFEINDGGLMDSTSSPGSWRREWGWGNPTYINPPEGYYCWATALDGDENLEDYNDLYLTIPKIQAKKARISFDSYLDERNDNARVQYKTTDINWTDLNNFTSDHNWDNYQFETQEIESDSIQFRFYYDKNDCNNCERGWYIDNLMLEKFQTSITHEPHPDTYNPYGPYQITAELSPSIEWISPLHIVYSIDGSNPIDEEILEENNILSFYFSGQPEGTEISYHFYAIDYEANIHFLKMSQTEDFSFSILESDGGSGFNLYSPADLSHDMDIYILMEWTDLGDPAATYTIQYGRDIDFTPGTYISKSGLTETEIYNPVDFIKSEIYYWRVFAVNSVSNDTIWANGGEKWQFSIINQEIPSILSGAIPIPANRTIIPENNPYYVQGPVSNHVSDTLSVRPGVTCEFTTNSRFDILGHLIADGTAENRITFKAEPGGYWNGINYSQSSPRLELGDSFLYISGPRLSYCDINDGFINDNGFSGLYIDHCDFSNSYTTSRITFGYVNECNFINGNSGGLTVHPLEDSWSVVNDLKVENSNFFSNNGSGLFVNYIDSVFVLNSKFNYNNNRGIDIEYISFIDFNLVEAIENGNQGLYIYQLGSLLVLDSYFNNNSSDGLYQAGHQSPGKITILNSTYNNNETAGLDVSGDSITVNNTQLLNNNDRGFEAYVDDYLDFSDNMAIDNNDYGVYCEGGGDKHIVNNSINNNGYGYYGTARHIMTDNQFIENGPRGSVLIEGSGNSEGSQILRNEIMFNFNSVNGYFSSGLNIYELNEMMIEDNVIHGNSRNANGNFWGGTGDSGQNGASLAALNIFGSNNVIKNNSISDNNTSFYTESGNWHWGSCSDVEGSNIMWNHGAGISMIGNNNTLYNNDIINNYAEARNHENQYHSFMSGGGVYAWGDNLLIRKNNISNNTIKAEGTYNAHSQAYGAGIYIEGKFHANHGYFDYNKYNNALIDSNIVKDNQIIDIEGNTFYSRGSGIYSSLNSNTESYTARTDIKHNEITGNSFIVSNDGGNEYQYGTGVYLIDPGGRSVFSNNTVIGNTSEYGYGGGVYTSVNIDSSTISQNLSQYGGGVYFEDIDQLSSYSIDYSTITNNTARIDFGAIYNPTIITNSIIVDNKVIADGAFNEDATGGIYSLNSGQNLTNIHYCNIYGNTGFNVRLNSMQNVDGISNWWNTRSDQIFIRDGIWDGYDSPGNLGVVTYQPILIFSSDQTPGQIEEYLNINVYSDNTYQMLLGGTINLNKRFFIEMEVIDGNSSSIDMSAMRVENLRNGDYIGPLVIETNLNTGLFRGSAETSDSTNFVYDNLRVVHGDSIRISPFNYPSINTILIVDSTSVDYMIGDTNDDSNVDVLDVMNIVYYILGLTTEINLLAADINGDSYLDLIDIIGVINIILGNPLTRESEITHVDVNLLDIYQEKKEGVIIPIDLLWQGGSIGGLEFTLESNNLEILNIHSEIDDANIFYNDIGENKTKCLIVSLDDNIITVKNSLQVFVTVDLQEKEGTLSLEEILISDQYSNVVSTVMGNNKTQIMALPEQFSLSNNYPNPFNPTTKITLALPADVVADVIIFNIRGQVVNNLITSRQMSGGYHSIVWNGKDNVGREVASGIYVLKFLSKEYSISRKMTLLR